MVNSSKFDDDTFLLAGVKFDNDMNTCIDSVSDKKMVAKRKPKIKTARVNLVIEPKALALIKAVSKACGCSLSSFMVIESTKAAEQYMAEHNNDLDKYRVKIT